MFMVQLEPLKLPSILLELQLGINRLILPNNIKIGWRLPGRSETAFSSNWSRE